MDDNGFASSRVVRGGYTSRGAHGNETVQAGLQGTGSAPTQGHADARAGRGAGRGGTRAERQPPDGLELGCEAPGGWAGMAAKSPWASGRLGCGTAGEALEDARCRGGGQWIPDRALDAGASGGADQEAVRTLVQHGACVEVAQAVGLLQPASDGARGAARRAGDRSLEGQALAVAQKKAQRERRTIVFIDETGISERPTRVRTWAPIGQTPVLQYSFRWTNLSLIAGITFWR